MINTVEKKYNLDNQHTIYKVTYTNNKVAFVPLDPDNKDYQTIQTWIADGGIVIDNPPE